MTTQSIAWRLTDHVRVPGGEAAAGVFGNGPPVVLTHGTPASSYLWRNAIPALARNHTVHAWDLLGYGQSRLGPGVAPTIEQQARTLAALVDHWQLDSPSLVGHDIGGGITMRAHLIEGVRSNRIALVDAAVIGPWNTAFTEHMQQYAEAYRTMPPHVFRDIISARLRTATAEPMADAALDAYLDPWSGVEGQRRWVDQVAHVSHEDTREVVANLDRITAPTLVLWGAQDGWLEPDVGSRLAAAIPEARFETIPGGHFLAEDSPLETAGTLDRFLTAP